MENYIVSARKYRPSTFSSVVGQKALTTTLRNAITSNRLAHAYLFCGSRGVGKTSCARIFAKTINCQNPTPEGDPCNECDSCRDFNMGRSLNIIELDAASNNSVDDMRQIVEQVQVSPTNGKYRVFIIDEVHMLTPSAFNAFLKTLEEPPSYVVFILATTEKHKIIPTILSRCQIYDFNRITVSDMVDHLAYVAEQEGIEAERAGLQVIARKADGAMRDALSIFDQVAVSSNRHITYASTIENLNVLDQAYYGKLVKAFMDKNVEQALLIYKEILDHGFDSHHFINGLAGYVRDLMVARAEATATLVDTDDETRRDMAELAAQVPVEFFYDAMSLCNEADLNYRVASSKTFLVELLLIRLCQLLGPSPTYSGAGEGQLYPIAASQQPQAAPRQASAQTQKAAPQTYPRQQVPAQPSQPTQRAAAYPAQSARPTTQPAQAYSAPASTSTAPPPQRSAAPAPSRPTGPVRKVAMSTHTTQQPMQATQPAQQQVNQAPRTQTIKMGELLKAWDAFAAARPKETILVNTFRACRPTPTSEPTIFNLTFENQLQIDAINKLMPELIVFLRNQLSNDYLQFRIGLNQSGPAPHIWNDHEILTHLRQTVPNLNEMIEKLNLKLL